MCISSAYDNEGFRLGAAQVSLPKALSTDVIVPALTGIVEAWKTAS
jgi:hypothetical protein